MEPWAQLFRYALLVGMLILLGVVACWPAPASADPSLPTYEGEMTFAAINGPSDPEEYSWEVSLSKGQSLRSIDSQNVEVVYEDEIGAFLIQAAAAHDADGSTVPTSLSVSEGDVITLTVHHRAGNPAAGGLRLSIQSMPGRAGTKVLQRRKSRCPE